MGPFHQRRSGLIDRVLKYVCSAPPLKREATVAGESLGLFRNAEAALSGLTTHPATAFDLDAILLSATRGLPAPRGRGDLETAAP